MMFPYRWLHNRGLRPAACRTLPVTGDSMEPTLPDGAAILVYLGSRKRREGKVFVIWIGEDLVVRRTILNPETGWLLVSDRPNKNTWATRPWPEDADIVGEVKWVGNALPYNAGAARARRATAETINGWATLFWREWRITGPKNGGGRWPCRDRGAVGQDTRRREQQWKWSEATTPDSIDWRGINPDGTPDEQMLADDPGHRRSGQHGAHHSVRLGRPGRDASQE